MEAPQRCVQGHLEEASAFFRSTVGTQKPAGCSHGSLGCELGTLPAPTAPSRAFAPVQVTNHGVTEVHRGFAMSPVPPGHRMRPRLLAIGVCEAGTAVLALPGAPGQ